jgi:ATP-dependent HslUV protease subunit HslV
MTTIAYRNGCIAADSASFAGWSRNGTCRKIARNAAGDLAGVCGSATYMGEFLRWFEGNEDGPPPEARVDDGCTDCALIIRRDGRAMQFEKGGSFSLSGDWFALGSGGPEARGAMHAGADAPRAVMAGIDLDAFSAGPIAFLFASDAL